MPCAACKLLRRKCTPECIFVPYFPAEQPWKFASVHQVYGTSNVAKLLRGISPELREDAVASLVYEAEARLMDPVHGSVAHIYSLQHKLRDVALKLAEAKEELAAFDSHHNNLPCLIQPAEASLAVMDIGMLLQMQPMFDGMDGGGGAQAPADDAQAPADDALKLAEAKDELSAFDSHHNNLPCLFQPPEASPAVMDIGKLLQMQPMFDGMDGGGGVQAPADDALKLAEAKDELSVFDSHHNNLPCLIQTPEASPAVMDIGMLLQMQPMFDGMDGGGGAQAPADDALKLAEAKDELSAFDSHHNNLPCLIQPPEASPAVMDIGKLLQMQPMFDGMDGGGGVQASADDALKLAEAKDELSVFDSHHNNLPCLIQPPEASPAVMDIGKLLQMQPMFDGMDGGGGAQAPADDELAWISSFMDNLDCSWMLDPVFQPLQHSAISAVQQPDQSGIN